MRKLAVLIPGSPTPAFYSQVAAFTLALRKLPWRRWEPTVYLYLAAIEDVAALEHWLPHLEDVQLVFASHARFDLHGDWVQTDDRLSLAPRDADVFMAADADLLPVALFEDVLERVAESDSVAGVIAHYPFPAPDTPREAWASAADGVLESPLDFSFSYTLMDSVGHVDVSTPFYVNFGVVFFSRAVYEAMVPAYLDIRRRLVDRLADPRFAGQVALTFATEATGVSTTALPMRFNFPNDPLAKQMYPEDLEDVRIFHYLRTTDFDRHLIFTSAVEYERFLNLPLVGVNRAFQDAVRSVIGVDYPFS